MLFIYTYLFNLYIRPQDWATFCYGWPVDYLIIIPALVYGFFMNLTGRISLARIPQYALLLALLIIIYLSNAVHGNFGFGVQEFIKFYKLICIFIIFLLLVNSTGKLKWTLFFIVLLSAFLASEAIYQSSTGNIGIAGQGFSSSGVEGRTRWIGLWDGPNILALLLNCAVPIALEFAVGQYPVFWRIVNLVLVGCLVGGVYTTNSRGGFVALLAILFLYPLFRLKKKKVAIILGILLAGAIFTYLSPSRLTQISTDEESAHIRTRLWGNGMDMFKENKLLGVGKGKFAEHTSRNMVAHSNFMQNLGEIGGIGIFVWLALVYFSFKGLYLVYNFKSSDKKAVRLKSLSRALMVSFLGFNICTIFITMEKDLFYLLLGLCAAMVNIMNREIKPLKVRFTLKDVAAICGIIIGLLLYYHQYTK